jgi:hypothetical protein
MYLLFGFTNLVNPSFKNLDRLTIFYKNKFIFDKFKVVDYQQPLASVEFLLSRVSASTQCQILPKSQVKLRN